MVNKPPLLTGFVEDELRPAPGKVVYRDQCFFLDAGNYHYEIEKSRIDTPEKLIRWIYHLATKPWFDKTMIRDLIEAVCDVCGLKAAPIEVSQEGRHER